MLPTRHLSAFAHVLAVAAYCFAAGAPPASAADLPIACVAGNCGVNIPDLLPSVASITQTQNVLDVNQHVENAVLNWRSFNISADGTVNFNQPSSSSVALNRIFQGDASRIFGALNANGRVYLINQNGILFGDGARVNVGGLVASSLNITPDAVENGIAGAAGSAGPVYRQSFTLFRDEQGNPLPSDAVQVGAGATLNANQGLILLAAPIVRNEGLIRTPDGQAVLAAGESVYLAASTDPELRGVFVEVEGVGSVTNGVAANRTAADAADLVGRIVAERGNITLAGMAVNQLGRLSATTSIRQNGSIRLVARDRTSERSNDVLLGERSVTEVLLATDDAATTVDANEQPRSRIRIDSASGIHALDHSRITATGGDVTFTAGSAALTDETLPLSGRPIATAMPAQGGRGRIYVAPSAAIDVSGASVDLAMERNSLRVELRGSQMADSPVQRDGPLRGQAVYVDVRRSGTREDGTTWQGTPLADVSGDISTIARNVAERNLGGGEISLFAEGYVIVAAGATLDVSGGAARYADGFVRTSSLLGADGRVYDIGNADRDRAYTGLSDTYTVRHSRWGVTRTFAGFAGMGNTAGQFEAGYVEGKDAGTVNIVAPNAILDGDVRAATTSGRLQRQPAGAIPAGSLYRPFDQMPLGGRLTVGNATATGNAPNYVSSAMEIAAGLILPSLTNDSGDAFDPLRDSYPTQASRIRIRPELFGAGRIARANLFSNEAVTLLADTALTLPAGGELAVTARRVAVDGDIDIPAGSIALTSRPTISLVDLSETGLTLGANSSLTARGRWINEVLNSSASDALFIQGGTIRVTAQEGDATLAAGSVIDVSGGGWRQPSGRIVGGRGGNIAVAATAQRVQNGTPTVLDLGSTLLGYSLSQGGELSIAANEVCIAAADCSDAAGMLWLHPQRFSAGGFGSYRIGSNRGGLRVVAGTQVNPRQQNLLFTVNPAEVASGAALSGVTRIATLADELRPATSLLLTTSVLQPGGYNATTFAAAPNLHVEAGATLAVDPGARIGLDSNSRLLLDGSLSAPGGSVELLLRESPEMQEFLPSQAIWLGTQSRISTAGVARIITDDTGLRQGRVLNGGTVNITAASGYIIAQPGSFIDVSGTQATIDVRVVDGSESRTLAQSIASAGGTLSMTAGEGMLLSGRWRADGGNEDVQGGTINLTIDAPPRTNGTVVLPDAAREITLQAHSPAVVIAPGTEIPQQYNGRAIVGADAIEEAGFDSVRLTARALTGAAAPSAIRLDGDLALSVGRQIVFDAPVLASGDGAALLSAPYISIGNSDPNAQTTPSTPLDGGGLLQVDANFIDLIGNFALQGFGRSAFASDTDIRLRGVQPTLTRTLTGSLRSAGDLAFIARQIYPSTLTSFSISAAGNERSIEIQGAGGAADDPLLSAGGRLGLTASRILQSGVLRAPFGEISLTASDLVLDTDSITSTSASGQTIPFGTTQGGFDWAYQLLGQTLVFEGSGQDVLPQQRVLLNGDSVDQRAGSVVDLSGGGDLLAYEFVRGTSGTRDYLSPSVQPNQFAIVPALNLQYAPYDQHEYDGVGLQPGDSIHLAGVEGLAAGTYVLMPARYALLPGAFLVRAVDGYQGIRAGEQYARLDGSTVVSGYRTVAGTAFRDSQASGFAVRPGADALRYAQYTSSTASQFFAAQAEAAGRQAPRLPIDAGVLSIAASRQLNLAGALRATAGSGGRGAAVDIAGRLRVVGGPIGDAPADGAVVIEAQALNRLGAESLLLGATRTQTADGLQLAVSADTVTIDENAQLQGQEIILAARDTVTVEANATIASTGAAARADAALLIEGDGALIRVAAGDQSRINRTYQPGSAVGATGTLLIRDGATLQSRGSVALDASRDASNAGRLDVAGASLNLSASRITLGTPRSAAGAGLVLSGDDLAELSLDELVLTSRSTIDLYGSTAFNVNRLIVEAGGIVGREDGAAAAISAAGSLRLANQNSVSVAPAASNGGTLLLSARDIELGAGTFNIGGFAATELRGSERIIADGIGGLAVGGDLSLVANRITTTAAATARVQATGLLSTAMASVSSSGAPPVAQALTSGLGGRLTLIGESIEHAGRFEMPSGTLELQAVGADAADAVVLRSGSVIDLHGVVRDFDGVDVGSPGGRLSLVSANADVQALAGSSIDIRGGDAGGVEAGSISVRAVHGDVALDGALLAAASESGSGGSAVIDAWSLGSFSALNRTLNVAGVTNERSVRLRGPGDLTVEAGSDNIVTARNVALTAEQGSVRVDGRIDANGSSGGRVALIARDDVSVSGTISAVAHDANQRGGRVELQSRQGGVRLASSSQIDVSGAASTYADGVRGGEVLIRATREAVRTVLDADTANDAVTLLGDIVGDDRTTLEAFAVYQDADGSITAGEVAATVANPRFAEASAFMVDAIAIREALGRTGDDAFRLAPGVEIQSAGNLTVATDWNLFGWRFGVANDAPGVLTLRAGGNLTFGSGVAGGSLSDGFSALTGANAFVLTNTADTWSYRLAAGADLQSVNALSVLAPEQLGGAGNFTIANGTVSTATVPATFRMVRTGNGNIEVAAGGNVALGNRASVLYTAGLAGPGIRFGGASGLGDRTYPIDGGDISIAAQGNVVGAATPQLVTDWLWRVGRPDAVTNPLATGWTVNFQRFEQNVGALAGGDVQVRAGGNIDNLSVAAPTIGRQIGGTTAGESAVEIIGGGDISLFAAGSIRGGKFYVGRGTGILRAGDAIDRAGAASSDFYPILALGDGTFDAVARTGLGIETVVNPTLLPQGRSQNPNFRSYFSTYADSSAVALTALGGDLRLRDAPANALLQALRPSLVSNSAAPDPDVAATLAVFAPSLRAAALSRDVQLGGQISLWPAPGSNLELFAYRDVLVRSAADVVIRMSDGDAALLPSIAFPYVGIGNSQFAFSDWISVLNEHARTPVHGGAAQAVEPVRVVAATGSLVLRNEQGVGANFILPKPARFVAAGDVIGASVQMQNLDAADVSSILAGGDIVYPLTRLSNGAVNASAPPGIFVDGPGRLELVAGGDVDFGTSNGVQTRGNTVNPALTELGADVSITAGVAAGSADFAAFTDRYLAPGAGTYSASLIDYVETRTGRQDLDHAEALRLFRLLDRSQQAGLIESTLFGELRTSGRAAAQPGAGNNDFTRAFAAMTTLFPGSNPDLDAGEANPYRGDISLYFSGVYTLDGGNISLLAPGGFVNAGLAAPPVDFGLSKNPESLGVVAQSSGSINSLSYGDFQVNESRVFSADGGDILVWSTRGDIDAGRGAKTAISAPAPTITIDADGKVVVRFPPALTGSGIQTIATTPGRKPGNVDLFAPRGVVNAGDAGIVAGNLTIAATAVLGADNIQVSGVAVGVPVDAGGLGASLSGVSAVASSASNAAAASIDAGQKDKDGNAPLAQTALSWLEVFVVGLGEEQCEPRDNECLKRQATP